MLAAAPTGDASGAGALLTRDQHQHAVSLAKVRSRRIPEPHAPPCQTGGSHGDHVTCTRRKCWRGAWRKYTKQRRVNSGSSTETSSGGGKGQMPSDQVRSCRRSATYLPCPPGSFTNATGSAACTACPPGHVTATSSSTSPANYTACGPGTYVEGSSCVVCGAGKASSAVGATSPATCKECEAGTYAGSAGSAQCTVCKKRIALASRVQ